MPSAALLLVGLSLLGTAAAAARPLATAQRRLAATGDKLPTPPVCNVADPAVQAAFLALDSSCPQAPPYSCNLRACWDAMDTVRFFCVMMGGGGCILHVIKCGRFPRSHPEALHILCLPT